MKDSLILLPNALIKLWVYQVLPFIFSKYTLPIKNKIIDWKIYQSWILFHNGNLKL